LISLLFNRDFYDISNKTKKELAIRSIDSKLGLDDNNIGFIKGYIFDFKLIGGPTEEDKQLFKKQADEEILALNDNITNLLEIFDEVDYENFVEKHCFTELDYESFLEANNLEDVSQFAEDHRYVILINEIEITDSSLNVSVREVLDSVKKTLYIICDVPDCIFIDSNYNMYSCY